MRLIQLIDVQKKEKFPPSGEGWEPHVITDRLNQSAHLTVRCLGKETRHSPLTETGYTSEILAYIDFPIIVHGIGFNFNKARKMPGNSFTIVIAYGQLFFPQKFLWLEGALQAW